MTVTLTVLALTVAMFVWGRIRSDVVALTALAVLLVSGILTPTEALAGFASPIVIMMAGLFVVGGAVLRTGLARAVGSGLVRVAHGKETPTFLLVMAATAFIGAFVSNTGTVALMMPIVISMATQAGFQSSRLLMPLAFAGSLGGMLTLIGTPPNLVIDEVLVENGYQGLGFFEFLPVGAVCLAIGIAVLLPLSRMLVSKNRSKHQDEDVHKTPQDLAREYNLPGRIRRYTVEAGTAAAGASIRDLDTQGRYGVAIFEIRNERRSSLGLLRDITQDIAEAATVLAPGDTIYAGGESQDLDTMAAELGLHRCDDGDSSLEFYDVGLAEIVVMPDSRLEGLRIRNSGLRKAHHINVIGIRRGNSYITDQIADTKMHCGDVLLVQGRWDDIQSLNSEADNWVVIGRPEHAADRVLLDYKAPVAAAIMLLMIAMMVFDFVPVAPVTAVIIAALLTIFTGCFRNVEAAYISINWESIVLIAAMMPLSTALQKTGVSSAVSQTLADSLGSAGPTAMLAGLYIATSLLTMFISNTATAVLMAPIAMAAATQTATSPYPYLFAVTLGASMCFASPFSTPPNALVMKAGGYTFMDYVRVGLPLQIVVGIAMILLLPLIFPF